MKMKTILKQQCKYIGMVGSKKKVTEIKKSLSDQNLVIPENKFYSPIGLKVSDGSPFEIAIEIVAEILKVKNNGELVHRRLI